MNETSTGFSVTFSNSDRFTQSTALLKLARTTKPLTNTEVNNAEPKTKIYSLHDDGGRQLRVKPNGSKSWLFDYDRPFTKNAPH
jgi:hypothetical protein